MCRIYIITFLAYLVSFTLAGQGVGDFSILSKSISSVDEKTLHAFIRAAREDGDSTKTIITTALLGSFLTHQQRYPEAEKTLLMALDNIQKMKFELRSSIPMAGVSIYDTYDYLGEFYTETANYKNAEFFFKESEKIRQHEFSRGSIFRLFNIQNLAQFYIDIEQNALAEAYLNKLIHELNRTKFNSEKLKYAYAVYYKGMTEICIRGARLEEAEKFLKKTYVFYASPFTSYKGAIRRLEGSNAETLLLQSRVLMMKGDTDQALRILETALRRDTDSLNYLPKLLRYKAICLFQKNNLQDALATSRQLLDVHLNNLRKVFPSLSEKEKEEFNRRIHYDFDLFNSLVTTVSRDHSLDTKLLESLIHFRLKTKALLLNNTRKIRQAIFASQDTALIHDFQRLSTLKNQASIEVFRKKSKASMNEVNSQIENLEKKVSYQIAHLNKSRQKEVDLKQIQERLSNDEVAIEIIQAKTFGLLPNQHHKLFGFSDSTVYFVLMIFKDRLDYTVINNGMELENRMIKFFKNSVGLVNHDSILYTAFWKPFAPKLMHHTTIYFSGDGVYNLINLNLLHNAHGYLLDQYEIILLSNLKDVASDEKSSAHRTGTFLGHPQYTLREEVKSSGSDEPLTRALRAASMDELKDEEFADLPGTENEVVEGASILTSNGWNIHTITGREADEHHVKEVKNPALLHLATHGFFVEQGWGEDPMLRSGLIFSGVKNPESINGEDGILTAYEASSLTLDSTRLVVLSACETGTGEVKNGEGVYGLQRAFMIAGAANIIMSLWKVDDTATQKLMRHFYAAFVKSNNVRLAFKEAQQTLRNEYPEPLYWGAFVMLGR
jgi:CHAT domain-containing protein